MSDDLTRRLGDLFKLAARYREKARSYTLERFSHALVNGQDAVPIRTMTEWDHRVLRLIYLYRYDEELNFQKLWEQCNELSDPRVNVHKSTLSQVISRLQNKYHLIQKGARKNAKPELTPLGQELCEDLDEAETLIVPGIAASLGLGKQESERLALALGKATESFEAQKPKATVAGVYDYLLGGRHHTVLDRDAGEVLKREVKFAAGAARANRAFLRRAVQFASMEGISQFIDIGSGLPTAGNTHEVAQLVNPDAKVLYVDNDPLVVKKSNGILRNNRLARAIHRSLDEVDGIFEEAENPVEPAKQDAKISLKERTAVIMVAIFHFLMDDARLLEILEDYRRHLRPGSLLIISHATNPPESGLSTDRLQQVYGERVHQLCLRDEKRVLALFRGTELVNPPGRLVYTTEWHPEVPDRFLTEDHKQWSKKAPAWESFAYAGVGRIPAKGR